MFKLITTFILAYIYEIIDTITHYRCQLWKVWSYQQVEED